MAGSSRLKIEESPDIRIRPSPSLTTLVDKLTKDRRKCDDLVRRWQAAEHALSKRARSEEIPLDEAYKKPWPEAAVMNKLMKRINLFDRKLPVAAEAIIALKSSSTEEAIAKICLGISLREPCPDDILAWALVAGGFRELRHLIRMGR